MNPGPSTSCLSILPAARPGALGTSTITPGAYTVLPPCSSSTLTTGQPGTILRGNAIHGIRRNAGRAPSNGIFFDQGTSETLTESNVFWDIDTTPLRWHWTYENRVAGNTLVLRKGQDIATYNRAEAGEIDHEDNRTVAAGGRSEELAQEIIAGAGPTER